MLSLYYIHIHMHFLEEQWKLLITLIDQYYPIVKIWAFSLPIVFIRHPEDLKVTKYLKHLILFLLFIH